MVEFEDGTFEIEIFCKICDSDKVELEYDKDNDCILVTCECGNIDRLLLNN